MKRMMLILTVVSALLQAGCTGSNPYRGVYEGIQIHNQHQMNPVERQTTPQMTYDQYEAERKH